MRSYFGVGDARVALRLLPNLHAMVSFAYFDTASIRAAEFERLLGACASVAVDSGAFTAWRMGKLDWPEHVGRYREFLRRYEGRLALAIAPDVIGDAEASIAAWRQMRRAGFAVVPVFHEGDPLEHLAEYVGEAGIVALGRIAGRRSKPASYEFYDEVFNHHPSARFHALGCSSPELLTPYPFESFDSVTWQLNSTYSQKFGWPWSHCSKEIRMRAYIEATSTICHAPPRQLSLSLGAAE